jgi:hypothetical protein
MDELSCQETMHSIYGISVDLCGQISNVLNKRMGNFVLVLLFALIYVNFIKADKL